MARITVEDCLENVDNRFELVMIGSKRARQLAVEGRPALVPEENDKPTVVALREIAKGLIDSSILLPVKQEFILERDDDLIEVTIDGGDASAVATEQSASMAESGADPSVAGGAVAPAETDEAAPE